ncbi:MAG: alpha/beta fold hydrolase [Myxococcales bacterium]|nr:alpha/beta fold hydrolase [Myxococcales bacterium]
MTRPRLSASLCLVALALACEGPRPPKPAIREPMKPAKSDDPGATKVDAKAAPEAKVEQPHEVAGPLDDLHLPLPDSLVADGVPPVPKSIAEAVGAYAEARNAPALSWHPREPWLLITTRFADTQQLHEVRGPGLDRRQLTFFKDKVTYASWPPAGDGGFLVYSKDIGGNEFAQNWRLDRATGQSTLLTDGASKNTLGAWTNAGDRMAYTSTRRNRKDTDLYVVDPRDPKTDKKVADVEGSWNVLDWSPDDRTLLVQQYVSVNESFLWTFDATTGERAQLTEKTTPPTSWSGGAFTADGRGVISTSDANGEWKQLVRLDLTTRKAEALTDPINWDIDEFAVSHDRKRLAAIANEDGFSRLHLYELPGKRPRPLRGDLPAGVIDDLVWHPDGSKLAFTVSSARSPADAHVLDTRTATITRWVDSEVGGLDPGAFAEPKIVRWRSFDEREIPGLYYAPPKKFAGKRPVVIIIHGGPEGQSRAGFITRNNYFLDELGVALIYPNVRGSTGYGKTYVTLDNADRREDSVKDIGALLDWIAAQPDLDADRVMVMGGSYGGYMTLAASVHYADRIRCAVDIVGISNFVTFLENTEAYRRDLRRAEYGDERDPTMRAHLQAISPLTGADKIKKPLFVIQGRNDPRVPASEAEQIVATLKRTGTPVWYLEGKDEGHGFAKKRNQDYQMYATILFMRTFLLAP